MKQWKFRPKKLKQRRTELGLRNRALADRTNGTVHNSSISLIETWDQTPNADIISALATALGVSPNHFFERE